MRDVEFRISESEDSEMKLFIGNLSYNTTEEELREILTEFGPVMEIIRPSDRATGKPRGFAFATFNNRDAGTLAIEKLDGHKLGGRELRVSEAEERDDQHPADRPKRVSMKIGKLRRVDDRPVGSDGKKIRYKSI